MKRLKKNYCCPVELAMDVLNGKWKVVILSRLKDRPYRYGELRTAIPNMSDKMLTERLKDLEEIGLIERSVSANGTKEIIYTITERGLSAGPALESLSEWGRQLSKELAVGIRSNDIHAARAKPKASPYLSLA